MKLERALELGEQQRAELEYRRMELQIQEVCKQMEERLAERMAELQAQFHQVQQMLLGDQVVIQTSPRVGSDATRLQRPLWPCPATGLLYSGHAGPDPPGYGHPAGPRRSY